MRPGRTALNYWCSWKQKLLILLKEKHMWDETLLIWITLDLAAVHCSFILLNVFFFGGMRSVHACYALSCYVVCPVSHNLVICLYLQGLSLGHGESQPSHLTHQLQRYTHTHTLLISYWTVNNEPDTVVQRYRLKCYITVVSLSSPLLLCPVLPQVAYPAL